MVATQHLRNSDIEPGYGHLFAVLMRRWVWVAGTLAGILMLAILYTLLKQPTYQSSMQLLVEPNYQGKQDAANPNQFADANIEIDNTTQLTEMRSSKLLQKAVDSLKADYPDINVDNLQRKLVLTQVEEDKVKTKIFQAIYTDSDPVKTQRVLQALQQVYQNYNREQQKQRLNRGLAFVNEQLPLLGTEVFNAEQALEQFRTSQNLIDPELQSKALIDSLTTLQQQQQQNQAQLQEMQARYQSLQQQLKRSPQQALTSARLSESSRYQALLDELQKTSLALEQNRTRFTESSPVIQKLLEQQQRQQALLAEESGQVLDRATQATSPQDAQLSSTELTLVSQLAEAKNSLQGLQARQQSLDQKVQSLQSQLKQFPALLTQYNRLQPNVKLSRETLEQLLKARQEIALEIARGGFDWQVVEQPKLGKHIGPKLKQNLLLGAVAGLMLGCVVAFGREGIDDSVHTPDDLKNLSALPLLGIIPELRRSNSRPAQQKAIRGHSSIAYLPGQLSSELMPDMTRVLPWVVFRESLDLIYKNIQMLTRSRGLRTLVVTSALSGEGKSTVALGLAMSAARLHQRVLLIDADLRRPSLHKQLELPNQEGLATLLIDEPQLNKRSIQTSSLYTDIPISVLTAGPPPIDPAQLLSSQRMGELIAGFEKSYDLVILDAPPVLGLVDAILAASFCDGVLLVGRMGQVTRTELTQATSMLNKLPLIGIVANAAMAISYPHRSARRY